MLGLLALLDILLMHTHVTINVMIVATVNVRVQVTANVITTATTIDNEYDPELSTSPPSDPVYMHKLCKHAHSINIHSFII